MNECAIYDFETLSQNQQHGAVISLAILSYTESRFISNPYTYEELLSSCKKIKFSVEEQVKKYNRTISAKTLEWWNEQTEEVKQQLQPSKDDVSIDKIYQFLIDNINISAHKKVFTRGNTFDPVFMDSLLQNCGHSNPLNWYAIRDTRSYIEGLSYGSNLDNNFIPEELKDKFVLHDPCHDIVMDVMRMQMLVQAIN